MRFRFLWVLTVFFVAACAGTKTSVGVGVYTPAIRAVASKDDGSKGFLAPLSYPLGVKAQFDMSVPLSVAVDYTPLSKSGPDSGMTSRYTLIRLMAEVTDGLSIGPSLAMHTQKGDGSVVELNNGGGTSDFAIPNSSVTSKIAGLNFAYDYEIGNVVIGNEIFWQGIMKKSRWNFAWLFSLKYQFGGGGNE